jgi:transitional endoplasmic reticulum ATPase
MKSSDLLSKWYGESEQQISRMFARARQVAPCVIFIDEIDSLVPARGSEANEPQVTARVVNTILAEMDGMEELNSIVVIGATNRPVAGRPGAAAARALRRAGLRRRARSRRAAAHPQDPHPQHAARRRCRPAGLAAQTERYTGADLGDVARRAGLIAIRQRGVDAEQVTAADFAAALATAGRR